MSKGIRQQGAEPHFADRIGLIGVHKEDRQVVTEFRENLPAVIQMVGPSWNEQAQRSGVEFGCAWIDWQQFASFVRVVNVPEGKQPDQLASEEIRHLLNFLKPNNGGDNSE